MRAAGFCTLRFLVIWFHEVVASHSNARTRNRDHCERHRRPQHSPSDRRCGRPQRVRRVLHSRHFCFLFLRHVRLSARSVLQLQQSCFVGETWNKVIVDFPLNSQLCCKTHMAGALFHLISPRVSLAGPRSHLFIYEFRMLSYRRRGSDSALLQNSTQVFHCLGV